MLKEVERVSWWYEMQAKFISAIDPTIRTRVLFLVKNGWAVSIITGYKFKYEPSKKSDVK